MTTNIAIIGAGNIGRCHLEALMQMDRATVIQVVDPNLSALEKAQQRIQDLRENPAIFDVTFHEDMRNLSDIIDVAIVATSSDVRCALLQQLLSTRHVRNVILEKVLFHRLEEYALAQAAIERHAVNAWVNCPRRQYDYYKQLKKRLSQEGAVDFFVSGVNWGMSSNSIHFIDIFSYLTGMDEIQWDTSALNPNILQSKRAGFLEVNGLLQGKTARGDQLLLRSYDTGNAPIIVDIRSENTVTVLNETHGVAWMASQHSGWQFSQDNIHVPYQSQLTHLAVQDILDEEACALPTFEVSAKQHIPWLNALQQFIRQHRDESAQEVMIT